MPAAAEDEIAQWATEMAESLDSFDVGDTVVYLDGIYWTVGSTNIEFDGYFASHKLERLPHAAALHDPSILPSILGDRKYWLTRERPSRRPDMG
jgi:hypothetical protein